MKWLDEFKIALVNEDIDKIDKLTDEYPDEMSLEQMECAAALLQSAAALCQQKQELLNIEFQKIKKVKQYNI